MFSWRHMAMGMAIMTLGRESAVAAEYSGRFSLGALWLKERYQEETQGTSQNDAAEITARAFLEVVRMGKAEHEFVLDLRDKHELYGKVQREELALGEANTFGLRQLAYKSSRQANVTWAVGRFPVPEAGVGKNDGAALGMRLGSAWRLGLFGGIGAPATARNQNQARARDGQAGVTTVYQTTAADASSSSYMANSLVSGPSYYEGEDEPRRLYFFNNGFWQLSPRFNLASLINADISPKAALQSLWLNGHWQGAKRTEVDASLSRWDLTQYEVKRELRDSLAPSAYAEARAYVKQGLTRTVAAKVQASYGRRDADGLARNEVAAGPLLSRLWQGRVSAFALVGVRDNFVSKDQFLRGGARYVGDGWDAGVEQELAIEQRKDRDATWHPWVTRVDFGGVFARAYMTSLGVDYAKDERVTIISGLLSLGYRFGNRILTPVPHQTPRPEALP